MNLYWLGVIIYAFGAATGAMIMWVKNKDVREENKELRRQLKTYRNLQHYWERD